MCCRHSRCPVHCFNLSFCCCHWIILCRQESVPIIHRKTNWHSNLHSDLWSICCHAPQIIHLDIWRTDFGCWCNAWSHRILCGVFCPRLNIQMLSLGQNMCPWMIGRQYKLSFLDYCTKVENLATTSCIRFIFLPTIHLYLLMYKLTCRQWHG